MHHPVKKKKKRPDPQRWGKARYDEGEEGHDLGCYEPLLRYARQQPERVELVAGFLPRGLARTLVKEGAEAAYGQARALGYLAAQDIQARLQFVLILGLCRNAVGLCVRIGVDSLFQII